MGMNANCEIYCSGKQNECNDLIVFAAHSLFLSIYCVGNECDQMQIHCPQNTENDKQCALESPKTLSQITFFAQNGFNDIAFDKVALTASSVICGADNEFECDINSIETGCNPQSNQICTNYRIKTETEQQRLQFFVFYNDTNGINSIFGDWMEEILLSTFDEITRDTKEWKMGSLMNATFCALFNRQFVFQKNEKCKATNLEQNDYLNVNAQYIAYGKFEIVSNRNENIDSFQLFVCDTFNSYLFKSVFSKNMNAKLETLQFEQHFVAISINADSMNLNTESIIAVNDNENESWTHLDIFLLIFLGFLISATCMATVYIFRYCHRRKSKNKKEKEAKQQSVNETDNERVQILTTPKRKRSHHWGFTEDVFGEMNVSNTFNSVNDDANDKKFFAALSPSIQSVEEMYTSSSNAMDGDQKWTGQHLDINENAFKINSYSNESTLEIESQKGIGNISHL